jgi:hypothetical protein
VQIKLRYERAREIHDLEELGRVLDTVIGRHGGYSGPRGMACAGCFFSWRGERDFDVCRAAIRYAEGPAILGIAAAKTKKMDDGQVYLSFALVIDAKTNKNADTGANVQTVGVKNIE